MQRRIGKRHKNNSETLNSETLKKREISQKMAGVVPFSLSHRTDFAPQRTAPTDFAPTAPSRLRMSDFPKNLRLVFVRFL
jgi:hypothetical protein